MENHDSKNRKLTFEKTLEKMSRFLGIFYETEETTSEKNIYAYI